MLKPLVLFIELIIQRNISLQYDGLEVQSANLFAVLGLILVALHNLLAIEMCAVYHEVSCKIMNSGNHISKVRYKIKIKSMNY